MCEVKSREKNNQGQTPPKKSTVVNSEKKWLEIKPYDVE